MMDNVLAVEQPVPRVMLLTLDRPNKRNAIDLDLVDALSSAFDRFRDEDEWRAAVITGRPPAFCAGLDLDSFSAPDAPRYRVSDLINSIPSLGKPVIAAVNGAAYTGGLELALACDFIVAADTARFADTHARIGALSGSGMGSRLPHAVGLRFAKQMMLTCEPIDAATALRVGLVNQIVSEPDLLPRAIAQAKLIAEHDPCLLGLARAVLDQGAETVLRPARTLEQQALARRKRAGGMRWDARQS